MLSALIRFTALCLISLQSYCQHLGFDAREATIDSVHQALFSQSTTCRDVTLSFLARISALNPTLNAIIALNPTALDTADSLDLRLAQGNTTGSLFCIPVLLKDCYDTFDMPTTGGNAALAGSQPTTDAPTVQALRNEGAVILGKTNLHELALEGLSVSSLGGQTVNPYDLTRTPGGSSGGSGAAVAASFSVFATGSDTVNSLRSPAAANNLDTVGPIARSVADVAIALTVMSSIGYDPQDNATALAPSHSRDIHYEEGLMAGKLEALRVGVFQSFFNRTASDETTPVNMAVDALTDSLKAAGASVVPITEDYNSAGISNTSDIQKYEYRESLHKYLQRADLLGTQPKSPKELYNSGDFLVIPVQYGHVNTALLSSTSDPSYGTALRSIDELTKRLEETFNRNELDCIIYPEQANLVRKLGSPSQSGRNGILAAVTGSPVVVVPAGFSPPTADAPIGVPIGVEILGRPWSEQKLLQIAYQIEQRLRFRRAATLADRFVEADLNKVPHVVPDVKNIPRAYPLGVLA